MRKEEYFERRTTSAHLIMILDFCPFLGCRHERSKTFSLPFAPPKKRVKIIFPRKLLSLLIPLTQTWTHTHTDDWICREKSFREKREMISSESRDWSRGKVQSCLFLLFPDDDFRLLLLFAALLTLANIQGSLLLIVTLLCCRTSCLFII